MRKGSLLFIVSAMAAVCLTGAVGVPVLAAADIKSKGNFVWDSGGAALYSNDIEFLQEEISGLFSELPDLSH